jgi:exoribonuclease-2
MKSIDRGEVGTVAFYAEKQQLIPALVAVRDGSRFVLEPIGQDRFATVAGRLFWAGRSQVPSRDALESRWALTRARAERVDLEACWKGLEGRIPPGPTDISELVALTATPGEDLALVEDAIAFAIFSDPTAFRIKDRALLRESEAAIAETRRKRAEKEAQRIALARATLAFMARLEGRDLPPETAETYTTFRNALIEVAAFGREAPEWSTVQPLCEALGVHPDHSFDLLVRLKELAPDANLAPLKAKVPLAFPEDAITEAKKLALHRPSPSLDYGHLEAIAIDDPDTTEVDDAVALDKDRIVVLIADAASYVTPGSLLDKQAALRTSTLYLPEGKVPMLPPELGEGPMSLNTGEPRSALAFSFEVAPDGRIVATEIARVRARIARRISYEEADQFLANDRTSALGKTLATLDAMMERHRKWRHGRGAVTFQRPEVYYAREPDGRVRIKIGDPLGPGRQLISELMVATCTLAAVYCAERQIPCIYRAQAAPDDPPGNGRARSGPSGNEAASRAVNPSSGRVDDAALQYDLLRRLKPSVLQTTPAPHWTLAVPAYSQVTSPIRRYADLLMHQQLTSVLKTGRPVHTASRLEGQLADLLRRQILVRRVEQESRRFYALRYLMQNPGLVLTGTVLREVAKKTLVELAPVALHELVHTKRKMPPGTVLRFEVIAVDPRKDELHLKELE